MSMNQLAAWHVRYRYFAFTLIELLVVVAIIVVLVAILLPSLSRAREQSKAIKCGAQMKQIGVAMYNYASENTGRLPPTRLNDPSSSAWTGTDKDWFLYGLWTATGYRESDWHWQNNRIQHPSGSAMRYNVFNCPVTVQLRRLTPTATGYYSDASASYGVNYSATGLTRSITLMGSSPMMVVLLENSSYYFNWTWPWIPTDGYTGGLLPHLGATNALYLDGHVELKKYKEIPYKNTWDINNVDIFFRGY